MTDLRRSPLHDRHVALGAKLADFGGWEMPIEYTASGGGVDDLIAYFVSDDDVFLVPNAANTAEVVRRLAAAAPPGVTVTDEHTRYGVLAVQGPRPPQLAEALGVPPGPGL